MIYCENVMDVASLIFFLFLLNANRNQFSLSFLLRAGQINAYCYDRWLK